MAFRKRVSLEAHTVTPPLQTEIFDNVLCHSLWQEIWLLAPKLSCSDILKFETRADTVEAPPQKAYVFSNLSLCKRHFEEIRTSTVRLSSWRKAYNHSSVSCCLTNLFKHYHKVERLAWYIFGAHANNSF